MRRSVAQRAKRVAVPRLIQSSIPRQCLQDYIVTWLLVGRVSAAH